jgi:NADH:ubiquinone oxidoreductase subunit E
VAEVRRYSHGSRIPGWDESVDLSKDPAEVPDPAVVSVPAELRETLEAHMAKYPDRRSAVIPCLASAQRFHGWCSPEAMEQVACVMRLTPGYIDAIATFYDMFETEEKGPHSVYVCTNISCSLRGADELYAAMQAATHDDPEWNVRSFECLGACDIAPMASVDSIYVGPLEPADASRMVDDVRAGRPVLEEKQLLRRPSADPKVAAAHGADPVIDPQASAVGPPMGDGIGGEQGAADHGEERSNAPDDESGP